MCRLLVIYPNQMKYYATEGNFFDGFTGPLFRMDSLR